MPWCYYIIYMCVHYELTMQRNSNFIWNNEINVVKEYKTNSWWLIEGFDKDLKTSLEFARVWLSFKLKSEWTKWKRNWRQVQSLWRNQKIKSAINGKKMQVNTKSYFQICITFKEAMRNQDFTLTCWRSTSMTKQ